LAVLLATMLITAIPASAVEQVADGGFEAANCSVAMSDTTCTSAVWTQAEAGGQLSPGGPHGPICSTTPAGGDCSGNGQAPRSGSKWFVSGGSCSVGPNTLNATASVSQAVLIPTGTATLTFYDRFDDEVGTSQMVASIDNSPVYTSTGVTNAYQPVSVNVSSFANGATHTLKFAYAGMASFGSSGCADRWDVDDISLDVVPGSASGGSSGSGATTTTAATGQRAAALTKCKKRKTHKARRRCRKHANTLPV